jgi:hypothetical protein
MSKRIARIGLPVVLLSVLAFGFSAARAAGGRSGGGGGAPGSGGLGSGGFNAHSGGTPGIQNSGTHFSPSQGTLGPQSTTHPFSNSGTIHDFKSFNSLHNISASWQSGGPKFIQSQRNWQSNQYALKNWKGNPWNWNKGGFWWGYYPFWWPAWGWGGGYGYVYDYGEPVYETAGYQTVSAPTADEAPTAAQTSAEEGADESAGGEYFAQSQAAFGEGHYKDALRMANHAAVESPQNPKAHELMSLSLFALGDYRGAAMEAHAALALGPAADWPTLFGYYGDEAKYTGQLRALEKYSKDNPAAADAHFLRAYHYLMMGHKSQFKEQMAEAAKLAPKDKLTGELLKKYGDDSSSSAAPPPPPSVLKDGSNKTAPKSTDNDEFEQ